MIIFLCIIALLVLIAVGYYFACEAGQQDPRDFGRLIRGPGPKVRGAASKALVPVRAASQALTWARMPDRHSATMAAERVARRIEGAATRQLALLNGGFPPATRLVTDKEPFDYEQLWKSCLAQ